MSNWGLSLLCNRTNTAIWRLKIGSDKSLYRIQNERRAPVVGLRIRFPTFKMHFTQTNGGRICPAANRVRRTLSCDAQGQNYFFFLAFFFFAFFAMVELLC